MEWTQEKLQALYVEVQKKAMTDEAFRKELLADSTKAIEALTGEKLPEGFKLKVIENDPAYTATMILPDLLGRELTDEEADAISGGFSFSSLFGKAKSFLRDYEDEILAPIKGAVPSWLGGKDSHLNIPVEKTK